MPAQLFQCVANSETGEHSRVLVVGLQLTLSSTVSTCLRTQTRMRV